MAVDHVEDQHLRLLGEVVQHGGEIGELVRPPALEQHRVHRRHAGDDHVVAPVRRVRADQLDLHHAVAHRRLRPEVVAGFIDRGRFHRQQLHRVVAEEDLVHRVLRQVVAEPLAEPLELPRERGERAARRRRRHVDLQDVRRRGELVGRLAPELGPVRLVAPRRLQPVQVVELRRGEGAEGQRRGQRVEDAVPFVVLVAPDEGVEVAPLLPRAGAHAPDGGEGMGLVARHRQVDPLEGYGLVRAREIERPRGREHLEEHVSVGDAMVEELRRPEAEPRDLLLDLAAEGPGDPLMRVERGLGRGQRPAAELREALRRVGVGGDAVLQRHGCPFREGDVVPGQARTSGSVRPVWCSIRAISCAAAAISPSASCVSVSNPAGSSVRSSR